MDVDENEFYKDNELVNVKLSRPQYNILQDVLRREEAYNYWAARFKSSWIWAVGGGLLTLWLLWDKIHTYVTLKV